MDSGIKSIYQAKLFKCKCKAQKQRDAEIYLRIIIEGPAAVASELFPDEFAKYGVKPGPQAKYGVGVVRRIG